MKRFLWISGGLAAFAILVPSSVLAGLYMGVVPGLMLALAPTLLHEAARDRHQP